MHMRPVKSPVRSLAAILVAVGALMLYGCVGNQATATDVNNKSFAFANGEVFHTALTTIPTTLTFTNNAKIFTLISPGGIATGSATLSPCVLTVTLSTYPAGTGPQVHDAMTLSTCDFESRTNTLTLANATISIMSGPAAALSMSGSVEPATVDDVNNRLFLFSNGAIFHAALTNIPTTLAFTNTATTFTLTSPGGTATGSATLSPCILTVDTSSTYPAGTGPQVNDVITLSACVFNGNNETLTLATATLSVTGEF
jgi:hypothetical protein